MKHLNRRPFPVKLQIVRIGIICTAGIILFTIGGCGTGTGGSKPAAMDRYVEGYKAYKEGDLGDAQAKLEKAVELNPDLRMARYILGEIYRDKDDFARAAGQYEVLSKIDPYTLDSHYYLGVSYQFLTRYQASTLAYLQGLKLAPQDFRSNMNLGTVYLAMGDVDSAVNYLDKATQLQPDSGTAWSNLGVALDARGSAVLAETSYRKALEFSKDTGPVLQNLANNLLKQNKAGEAIYLWQQVIAKENTPYTLTRLAEAYSQAGDFEKAVPVFDKVLADDAKYIPAINGKADLLIRRYETGGYVDDELRQAAMELYKSSLSLNGEQTHPKAQLKKWAKASAFK